MAIDVSLLTTRAECDAVLSDLAAELAGYQNRTTNLAYAEDRAERATTKKSSRLADVEADIEFYEYGLAKPDLSPERRLEYESKLRRANDKRDNLNDPGVTPSAVKQVLAAIDNEQVAAQVTTLTAAQTQVQARRDALPA